MTKAKWLCAGLTTLAFIGGAHAQDETTSKDPIMFVVDGSNSMWGQMDGVSKIELTKSAFSEMLPKLDASRPAGLVMYGHREKANCGGYEYVTTSGDTIAITVPEEPGSYELRYVAVGHRAMILARQPLTIQ